MVADSIRKASLARKIDRPSKARQDVRVWPADGRMIRVTSAFWGPADTVENLPTVFEPTPSLH